MFKHSKTVENLREDVVNIILSVLFAWFLISSGVMSDVLLNTGAGKVVESFVAGLFFTSAFTLAPASVILAELSQNSDPLMVAFFGALGAMIGDLALFLFIRDRLASDIKALFRKGAMRRFLNSFHFGFWKWLAPVFGALIIASPLPDELGLSLLGLSKVRVGVLLPLSFAMNFLGILAVSAVAGIL